MTSTNIATSDSPVQLTEGAYSELKRIMQEQSVDENYGLRIGVKGGGCSGFSYILGFDKKKDNDSEYQIGELTVIMEKAHGLYLAGMEIDYVDGLSNRGFTFSNPNATETCGCGSSFAA